VLISHFKIMNLHFINFLLIIVFSFKTISISAQKSQISDLDSLMQSAQNENISDKNKVNAYLEISNLYRKKNIDSAMIYAEKGIVLAENLNYKKGIILSLIRLAQVKKVQSDIEQGNRLLLEAIEYYEEFDEDKNYLIICNLLGIYYQTQSNIDKSLEYFFLGLKSSKDQNNQLYRGYFLGNISTIYDKIGNEEEGLKFALESSSVFKKLGNNKHYGYSLINIGHACLKMENYDLAMENFNKAEKIHLEVNDNYALMQIYADLARIAKIKEKHKESLSLFLKAQKHALLLDELFSEKQYGMAIIHNDLGNIYLLFNNYTKAIKEFYLSNKIGKKLNSLEILQKSYKGLHFSYLKLYKVDSASFYFNLFLPVNDSLFAEKYNNKIDEINYNYKFNLEKEKFDNEKEQNLAEQKRHQLTNFLILSISSLLILLIGFLWYIQKNKFKQSQLRNHNLRVEKERLTFDLERKNKELTSSVLHLIERNEFISKIAVKLENINPQKDLIDLKKINDMIKNIDRNDNRKLWKEFELRYIEVHSEFFQKLSKINPKLTSNDRRLCALAMLNMSIKEISSITYQSEQSIKIARYRLRKKLGLAPNENLTNFLHNL